MAELDTQVPGHAGEPLGLEVRPDLARNPQGAEIAHAGKPLAVHPPAAAHDGGIEAGVVGEDQRAFKIVAEFGQDLGKFRLVPDMLFADAMHPGKGEAHVFGPDIALLDPGDGLPVDEGQPNLAGIARRGTGRFEIEGDGLAQHRRSFWVHIGND